MLESSLHHKSLPSIKPLPVAADLSEQRAESQPCWSHPGQPRCQFSTNHVDGSGAIPAPEKCWQTSAGQGRALWGSPAALLPRWCSCRNKCPPLRSSTACFGTKCQRASQIKTLKMYEQQLSHTRKLITVGELFLLRSGQAIFNIPVLSPSYGANKLSTRKTH